MAEQYPIGIPTKTVGKMGNLGDERSLAVQEVLFGLLTASGGSPAKFVASVKEAIRLGSASLGEVLREIPPWGIVDKSAITIISGLDGKTYFISFGRVYPARKVATVASFGCGAAMLLASGVIMFRAGRRKALRGRRGRRGR